ncbi:PD-(D/E)XK nuclease family protein [Methylorubrum sp. SB2]|uniref:PD-(D/E)XK nuclease family protein n=1 Tax=Methylorubrum subtropicum TaxID=3138812 RepID=UPI00313EB42F
MQASAKSPASAAPNLFKFATKELSQDAFFCWLLAWADSSFATADAALHGIGRGFVDMLLCEHTLAMDGRTHVLVHRQYKYVDILVEVGDDLILLIEDKVHAGIHGNQLTRYRDRITEAFPGRRIAPVFLKTGDQARYDVVEAAGFKRVGRDRLLKFLRQACAGSSHPILHDFLAVLEELDAAVQAFRSVPPAAWEGASPWIGLYISLQTVFADLNWQYTPNPSGGFLAAWWHGRSWTNPATGRTYDVYLQIEQGPLCFKIAVEDGPDKVGPRDAWRSTLTAAAQRTGQTIQPLHRKPGTWMTVARLDQSDWMQLGLDGLFDPDATVLRLRAAMDLVNEGVRAVQDSQAAH